MPRLCGKVKSRYLTTSQSYDCGCQTLELRETIKENSWALDGYGEPKSIDFACTSVQPSRHPNRSRKSSQCRFFRTDAPYSYRMSSKVHKRLSSSPKMNATLSLSADGLTLRKEKLYVTIHFLVLTEGPRDHFTFSYLFSANHALNHH